MSNPYSPPEHSDKSVDESLTADVRGMQIITLGMAGGAMSFLFVALVMNSGEIGFDADVTSWIGLGFAAILFVIHFIAPGFAAGQIMKQVDSEQLKSESLGEQVRMILPAYRQQQIVGCALLEGAAFMNLVFYLIDQYVGNLAAAVFLIVVIVLRLPTESRVTDWARQRIQEIELR